MRLCLYVDLRFHASSLPTGRIEGVKCGLGLKYALIVAAVVNEAEIIQQ